MNNMRKLVGSGIIFLSLIFGSCSKSSDTGNLYTPTSADVTASATLTDLQQGRTLYINNCGACHNLYSPDSYSVTQWKNIMNSMAPKTSMTSSQDTLVLKYVTRGKL